MNQMGRASSSSVFPSLCFLLFLALCHTLVPADGAAPPQEDSKGEPKEPVPQSSGWSRSVVQGLRDLIDSQPHLRQFTLEARNWHSLPAAGGGRSTTPHKHFFFSNIFLNLILPQFNFVPKQKERKRNAVASLTHLVMMPRLHEQ